MKYVFIDTNKYLDLYRGSSLSLNRFNALIKLIEDKKIEIIIPKQVLDEFYRDKEIVYKSFIKDNFKLITIPGFWTKKKEISKINSSIKKIEENYRKNLFNPKSKVNISSTRLFSIANIPLEEKEILDLAYYRTLRRNPPRKDNNSFGDAIIWETLLRNFSNKDLIIISGDGDFSSEIDQTAINPFLKQEWFSKKKKKLTLRTNLAEFILDITKDKKVITEETIREEEALDKFGIESMRISDTSRMISAGTISVGNIGDIGIGLGRIADGNANSVHYSSYFSNEKCACCGKEYVSDTIMGYGLTNRCKDCQNFISVVKNCRKCGKHFHSITGSENLCPNCSK